VERVRPRPEVRRHVRLVVGLAPGLSRGVGARHSLQQGLLVSPGRVACLGCAIAASAGAPLVLIVLSLQDV
jgi:hypothetical protein